MTGPEGGAAAASVASVLRTGFPCVAFGALWLAWRRGRPGGFVLVLLLAQAWAWTATNAPLGQLYGLSGSSDRAGNLQLVQVVAAGNPWYGSAQVGQYSFEPGWGLLVALAAGFDPERVLALYPFLGLLASLLFVLSVAAGIGRAARDPWAGVTAAAFASLLASSPVDFSEHYRDPWAMMFLLKPNHAVGLVAAPLLLWAAARAARPASALLTGALLGLVGWLCVFHMVLIWAGLCLLAAMRPLKPPLLILGSSALLTSPYLYVLLVLFPAWEPHPSFGLPRSEAYALWTTSQSGLLLPLAAVGLLWLRHRDAALYRQWAAALAGAWLFWWLLFPLALFDRARERDEVFFWMRFLTAALAGAGAWAGLQRLADRLPEWARSRETRAALLLAATVPCWLPSWWDPERMDDYFSSSVPALAATLAGPGEYLRRQTSPSDVVAGDPSYMKYAGALGARRSLYSDNLNPARSERRRLGAMNEALVRGGDPRACREARALGVRHLVLTSRYLESLDLELGSLERRPDLLLRHLSRDPDGSFVAVFEMRECRAGS